MKTNRLSSVCLWTAVVLGGLCAFAQDKPALQKHDDAAPQKPDVTVQVKVVNVPATVRDKHGKIVNNLTKEDFVLEEEGHPQAIRYFAKESDLPLTLGLLVDTSYSQRRVMDQERSASGSFLDNILRPEKDQAFLIHFDHEVELLQDLTPSREKLRAALASMDAPHFSQTGADPGGSNGGGSPGGGRHGGGGGAHGGTLLYDAIYLASDELMKKQTGRKAIVVLSDGVDRGSKESLRSAIEAAQRADTIVYSILFKDEEHENPFGGFGHGGMGGGMGGPMGRRGGGGGRYPQEQRPDGKKILEQISKETGGRLFEVSSKQTADRIYAQIEEELRNQYNLGYSPEQTAAGYHRIDVKTRQKDLSVQARQGYYGE
jgi:VWFA-related protein